MFALSIIRILLYAYSEGAMFICVMNTQANVRYHNDTVHLDMRMILGYIKRAWQAR